MEALVERKALAQALTRLAPFVAKRTALPVLQGVKLEASADKGRLIFEGTDLEMTAITEVTAKVKGEATVLLRFSDLRRVVTATKGKELMLAVTPEGVNITDGQVGRTVETLVLADYPADLIDAESVVGWEEVAGDQLMAAMTRIAVAADNRQERPILTCLALEPGKDGLAVVATDSYRLAYQEWPIVVPTKDTLLVPARFIRAVAKAGIVKVGHVATKPPIKDNRQIKPKATHFVAAGPGFIAQTRLVEGSFPAFRNLLPDKAEQQRIGRKWSLNLAELAALKGVGKDALPIRLDFATGGATVIQEKQAIFTTTLSGLRMTPTGTDEAFEMAFNPDYLADIAKVVGGEKVELTVTDNKKPGIFRAEGEPSYLLMPVRM